MDGLKAGGEFLSGGKVCFGLKSWGEKRRRLRIGGRKNLGIKERSGKEMEIKGKFKENWGLKTGREIDGNY